MINSVAYSNASQMAILKPSIHQFLEYPDHALFPFCVGSGEKGSGYPSIEINVIELPETGECK